MLFRSAADSASRFIYCAKASGRDRGNHTKGELPLFGIPEEKFKNTHATVKPLALMEYLVKLVTMPQPKACLDPFMGSGTTGVAAVQMGRKFIGIEREPSYFDIACKRIEQATAQGQIFNFEPPKMSQDTLDL